MLKRIVRVFKEAVFPTRCLRCGSFFRNDPALGSPLFEMVRRGETGAVFDALLAPYFCRGCSAGCTATESPLCPSCGVMFTGREGGDHLCGACLKSRQKFGKARSAGIYGQALMAAVHRLKYGGKIQLARPLGLLLLTAFLRYWENETVDLVVPVPLHPKKMRSRGFNQSFLLVRQWDAWVEALDIPKPYAGHERKALVRNRDTRPQTGLPRSRRVSNIENAFSVVDAERIAGKRILLIDDVITTGATTAECTRVLLKGGAGRVDVLTLARVG